MQYQRLGVNIDHVATLRNARGGMHPDPVRAAIQVIEAGADSITVHLREDRRHIRDSDVTALKKVLTVPMNLEMAATSEMQEFALSIKPHAVCLVPEKREERTTEGGLDVAGNLATLREYIAPLTAAGMRVSFFIDPLEAQLTASLAAGAGAVELHTGTYADTNGEERIRAYDAIRNVARLTRDLPLECHAGHGLNCENVGLIAAIPDIIELNIGHFLIGEALFGGLSNSIMAMRAAMDTARAKESV
jgi:pyridoxine 5-phosphate synthase